MQNPIGIEDAAPRLFWQLQTAREGARQIAYQIRVASSPDIINNPDFWDSGRVESAQTTHVIYQGAPLTSRQRAWWQVRVWDETGDEIQSEIAFWENGLRASDWQARWIAAPLAGGPNTSVPAPFLRRAFEVQKPIKQARLYASALGIYECEINGAKVGNDIFAPGWTDYKQRVQYQTFDVTAHLQSGTNVWGAVLGDGWYCGHVEWRGRQRYGDRPKFFGQLEIEYEDGTRQTIVSDETWRYAFGPILQADLIMGESHDARQELRGWSAPDFEASAWQAVHVYGADEFSHLKISAPLGPPVVAQEEITPVREPYSHPALPSTAWVFDMGQNMVGRVRLKVSGPRGATVRLRYAETLAAGPAASDGPIYTANLRSALQTDFYTLRGDGEEIWEPRFSFHGFRYVEVVGFPGTPTRQAITGVVIHSDTPQTGDFECSDPLVTQLQRNIDWGQRGNFLDVPTDCPQRDERLGWTGDAQVFARTAAFNRDVAAFFREWMRDVADAQTATGGVPCTVPDTGVLMTESGPHSGASQDGGPAWSDALLIVPLTMYRCFGDRRILEENYETFARYLDFQQNTARDSIRCYDGCEYFPGFGDWLALDGSGKTEGGTPRDLIGTAFFAHAADLMRQIAAILGKNDDAARYGALFETVRGAFQKRFITPAGLIVTAVSNAVFIGVAIQFNARRIARKCHARISQKHRRTRQ